MPIRTWSGCAWNWTARRAMARARGRRRGPLEQAVIGKAVDLLSGPGGLASFLRRRQLGARLGGPSLPLDIGYSETVPAGIRNAVMLRDRHCQWAGRCDQPAEACQVHHTPHKAHGGTTSVKDCVLLCRFHHQVVIHRWGWTLVLNPDGTTTAWNKDKTKVLHSHGPPARAGVKARHARGHRLHRCPPIPATPSSQYAMISAPDPRPTVVYKAASWGHPVRPAAWDLTNTNRAILDKSPNHLAGPARRLMIGATYPL